MTIAPPPRPPTRDELEALIPEARERQRRRRLLLFGVLVLAAACVSWLLSNWIGAPARSRKAAGGGSGAGSVGAVVAPRTPAGLAIARNGDLLVIDRGRDQILERLRDGRFRVFAGTGRAGFSGDGGQAVHAELNQPSAMAVGPDGSVYVADRGNNRIRRISRNGVITTVAGNGRDGWTPDEPKATSTAIASPAALALGPGGQVYIATAVEVLRMNRDGTLSRISGIRGPEGVSGLGRASSQASVDGADALAFDRAGDLYLAGFNTKTLLMIDRSGIMRAPLGTKIGFYPRGSGGLTTAPDGHVVAIETQRIVELSPHRVKTMYKFTHRKIGAITGFLPAGIAITRSGLIYTDTGYGNGWSNGSAIVSLKATRHLVRTLWSHQRK